MESFFSIAGKDMGGNMLAHAVPYNALMGFLWSGTIFSFITIFLRLAFRIKIIRRLRLDDYLVIASFICFLGSTILWSVLARNLYLVARNWNMN
ncbi:hypothetical protein QBC36DRAFT_293052 [Triangularia setosa]|uniref:Uncharacterized protein n=1 Tax=Triangularia setosa TaxID=2587417 RepID=A0AAN6W1S3_9PEZI|nr:hypothetical protein QBC36DRAFT_293052 [Podospora setosa]